jgi:SecD/SecF fusion protein
MHPFPPYIGHTVDGNKPLLLKCLPFLYRYLPPNSQFFFKEANNNKAKIWEVYIANGGSVWDASRNIKDTYAEQIEKRPTVNLLFDKVGTQRWAGMTARNVGSTIAIVVDGELLSAPMVLSPIESGSMQIAGNFTAAEATNMATGLRSGYLPLNLRVIGHGPIRKP